MSDSEDEEEPVSDIKKLRLNSTTPQQYPSGPKDVIRLLKIKHY